MTPVDRLMRWALWTTLAAIPFAFLASPLAVPLVVVVLALLLAALLFLIREVYQ